MDSLLKKHAAWKVRNAAYALHLSEQEEMIDAFVDLVTRQEREIQMLKTSASASASASTPNPTVPDISVPSQSEDDRFETLKNELEQEKDIRARWQARAKDVESQIQKEDTLQVLVLIDGNHHFFDDALVKAGPNGARDAVHTLLEEVRGFARSQHKHDSAPLPENIKVVVHVFCDIGRLADDLSTANLLPDPDALWGFVQEICKIEPFVTASTHRPSGSQPGVVCLTCASLTTVEDFYSLCIENCHVRHVFLAMSPSSGYYNILQLYNDDDYTRKKTSLVEPGSGFPPGLGLAYHTARFSSLKAISSTGSSVPEGRITAPTAESNPRIVSAALEKSGDMSDLLGSIDGDWVADTTRLAKVDTPPTTAKAFNWESEGGHLGQAPIATEWEDEAKDKSSTTANRHKREESSRPTNQGHLGRGGGKGRAPPIAAVKTNGVKGHGSHPMQSRLEQRAVREFEGSWDDIPPDQKSTTEGFTPNHDRPPSAAWSRAPSSGSSSRPDAPVSHMSRSSPTSRVAASPMRAAAEVSGPKLGIIGRPGSSSSSNESAFLLSTTRGINGLSRKTFQSSHVRQRQPEPERRPVFSPIALNKYGQRIDLSLPTPTSAEQRLFQDRHLTHKLCNHYHLRAACTQPEGKQCPYDHGEIDTSLYLQLRSKARLIPCVDGPDCRDQTCFNGHHCPNVGSLRECGRPNCPFGRAGMHDTRSFEVVKMIDVPEVRS